MDRSSFHIFIKTLCFLVICHQCNQDSYALRFALGPQCIKQRLSHLMVSFAFEDAYPIEISTEAGGVTSAADQRSVYPSNHLIFPQCNKG